MDKGEIIIYQTGDGKSALEVNLREDTVWLTQKQMGVLFDKDTDTIGLHIRNIFKEGELEPRATTEESSVVQDEGGRQVRRKVKFFNLDVIISVGYRVKSLRGTQFRIWANGDFPLSFPPPLCPSRLDKPAPYLIRGESRVPFFPT